jgi:ABC-type uncharacterized transport system fused permease/ATPase subunit
MFDAITQWIVDNFTNFVDFLKEGLISLFNRIIEAIASFIGTVVDLLPDYTLEIPTFASLSSSLSSVGGYANDAIAWMNWLFPVDFVLLTVTAIVANELVYVVVAPVLRWFKVVR